MKLMTLIEKWNFTIFMLINVLSSHKYYQNYLAQERMGLKVKEKELLAELYYRVMQLPTSSDKALSKFIY